jgi:hypothetical protein
MDLPSELVTKLTKEGVIKELKESARRDLPGDPDPQHMKPLALGKHPGFAYSVSVWRDGTEVKLHMRVYLVHNKAYALCVIAANAMRLPVEDIRTFMNSFSPLLEKEGVGIRKRRRQD